MRRPDPAFWAGRRVLVTGHTGFKGAWLSLMLEGLGADVTGFALPPEDGPTAFGLLGLARRLEHHEGDLREPGQFAGVLAGARPSIVLHLAAQALVLRSYRDPASTFSSNVGGTVAVLEALRCGRGACEAAVMVTSDKVYRNDGDGRAFREDDPLGGHDPYSASKAACEMAVQSYRASYPSDLPPTATARAGNVIGGGDFGQDRLVPDMVRAEETGRPLLIRYPQATRPFQHVLDVLIAYLLLAEDLARVPTAPRAVNVGWSGQEIRVAELIDAFSAASGRPVPWELAPGMHPPEAPRLALDATLARDALGWRPRLGRRAMLAWTAEWYAAWRRGDDLLGLSRRHCTTLLDPSAPIEEAS